MGAWKRNDVDFVWRSHCPYSFSVMWISPFWIWSPRRVCSRFVYPLCVCLSLWFRSEWVPRGRALIKFVLRPSEWHFVSFFSFSFPLTLHRKWRLITAPSGATWKSPSPRSTGQGPIDAAAGWADCGFDGSKCNRKPRRSCLPSVWLCLLVWLSAYVWASTSSVCLGACLYTVHCVGLSQSSRPASWHLSVCVSACLPLHFFPVWAVFLSPVGLVLFFRTSSKCLSPFRLLV